MAVICETRLSENRRRIHSILRFFVNDLSSNGLSQLRCDKFFFRRASFRIYTTFQPFHVGICTMYYVQYHATNFVKRNMRAFVALALFVVLILPFFHLIYPSAKKKSVLKCRDKEQTMICRGFINGNNQFSYCTPLLRQFSNAQPII